MITSASAKQFPVLVACHPTTCNDEISWWWRVISEYLESHCAVGFWSWQTHIGIYLALGLLNGKSTKHHFNKVRHDFAGKGVLNVLGKVLYQSEICRFRAMTLSPLHLVVNVASFYHLFDNDLHKKLTYCRKITRYCVQILGIKARLHESCLVITLT